jgi:hypothetical protein
MPDVSTSMVCTVMLVLVRWNEETIVRAALKPAALESTDSQFWPEKDAAEAIPLS